MSPAIILSIFLAYFLVLVGVARITSRGAGNDSFFIGDRQSPWFIVAFGMIGASLSGITFISVPGQVGGKGYDYLIISAGYILGYLLIAYVLLPVYYRLQVVSIYEYLEQRFGMASRKLGAWFFLFSRLAGASLRLFLVALTLDQFVLGPMGVPYELTVLLSVVVMWLYTFKGGIKTIIWTDTLQTALMLFAMVYTFIWLWDKVGDPVAVITDSDLFRTEVWSDWQGGGHWLKLAMGGAITAFAMTGLDQDMMQKNLSCKNLKESRRNILSFSWGLLFVNLLALALGSLLVSYVAGSSELTSQFMEFTGGEERTDLMLPFLCLEGGGAVIALFFILGLTAAAYSSADSALTALTTSFTVDILEKDSNDMDTQRVKTRVHIAMSITLVLLVILAKYVLGQSAIWAIFTYAAFTYGPLLGLFVFGLTTRRPIREKGLAVVIPVCILLTLLINGDLGVSPLGDFSFGPALLILNGFLCYVGMWIISSPGKGSGSKSSHH